MRPGSASIGVRELRADLATAVRRAGAGQRIVVSVGGRPTAVLAPVENSGTDVTVEALVAAGLLLPPRRTDDFRAAAPVPVWSGVRLDKALREVRGVSTFFDTSAVVALHIDTRDRRIVIDALEPGTCVSVLSLTESLAMIAKLTEEPTLQADIEDALRLQWDRYAVVPVDQRCLDRAAVLLREQPVRLADALHLAAAERLPRPIRYVTFDPIQIPVALGLGYDVVSS